MRERCVLLCRRLLGGLHAAIVESRTYIPVMDLFSADYCAIFGKNVVVGCTFRFSWRVDYRVTVLGSWPWDSCGRSHLLATRARSPQKCYHHHTKQIDYPHGIMPPPDSMDLSVTADACNPGIYHHAQKVLCISQSRQKQMSKCPPDISNIPRQRLQETHDMKHDAVFPLISVVFRINWLHTLLYKEEKISTKHDLKTMSLNNLFRV